MIIVPPPMLFRSGGSYTPRCRHCGQSYPLSEEMPPAVFWLLKLTILTGIAGAFSGWWLSAHSDFPDPVANSLCAVLGIMLGVSAPWVAVGLWWCIRFLFRSRRNPEGKSDG